MNDCCCEEWKAERTRWTNDDMHLLRAGVYIWTRDTALGFDGERLRDARKTWSERGLSPLGLLEKEKGAWCTVFVVVDVAEGH